MSSADAAICRGAPVLLRRMPVVRDCVAKDSPPTPSQQGRRDEHHQSVHHSQQPHQEHPRACRVESHGGREDEYLEMRHDSLSGNCNEGRRTSAKRPFDSGGDFVGAAKRSRQRTSAASPARLPTPGWPRPATAPAGDPTARTPPACRTSWARATFGQQQQLPQQVEPPQRLAGVVADARQRRGIESGRIGGQPDHNGGRARCFMSKVPSPFGRGLGCRARRFGRPSPLPLSQRERGRLHKYRSRMRRLVPSSRRVSGIR